jgi:hypothetical protein
LQAVQDFFDGLWGNGALLGGGVAAMGFGEPSLVDVSARGVVDAEKEFFGEGFALDGVELHGVKFELLTGHGHGDLQMDDWIIANVGLRNVSAKADR